MHPSWLKPKLMSKILRFPESIPKEKASLSASKSLKLMLNNGLLKHISPGIFTLMPLTIRAFEKLCHIIDNLMVQVEGQKVLFPTLISEKLMKSSGRWNTIDSLFKLKDRSSLEYCLGPTHEEVASYLFSNYNISHRTLPLRLYQISSKFRDEKNPKLGLLRGREFIMKDMYAFDSSEENSKVTYEEVTNMYSKLFASHLGIEPIKVQGCGGDIGGSMSHEFHFVTETGEDEILFCPNCKTGINTELLTYVNSEKCVNCNVSMIKCNSLEVGHAFQLGMTYSKPFGVKYDSPENKLECCHMSCYGLGVSRILAATLECLSISSALRWPLSIVPFHISVIPPKLNSKEESARPFSESLADSLNNISYLKGNVVVDDRNHLTIGKRVHECSELGIPYIIVVAKKALSDIPKLEIIDVYNEKTSFLTHRETLELFKYRV